MTDGRATKVWANTAAVSWLVVGGHGAMTAADADGWLGAYGVFAIAVAVAAMLTVCAIGSSSTPTPTRPRLHSVGLAVGGLAVVASIVAWALPLWMTALGVAGALVASASRGDRVPLIMLAIGPFAGLAALIGGVAAELGSRDEHGDYPAASGVAVMVTAVTMILGLVALAGRGRIPATADAAEPIPINPLTH